MKTTAFRLSLALLAITLGSGCRGARIRELEHQIDLLEPRNIQLEDRIAQLENRVSSIEERMEVRLVPVESEPQPRR